MPTETLDLANYVLLPPHNFQTKLALAWHREDLPKVKNEDGEEVSQVLFIPKSLIVQGPDGKSEYIDHWVLGVLVLSAFCFKKGLQSYSFCGVTGTYRKGKRRYERESEGEEQS